MPRRNILPLVCLALTVCGLSHGHSQEPSQDDPTSQNAPKRTRLSDRHDKFQKLDDPPLAMGHTGDRVRELQTTLNLKLGGMTIELRHPIEVGPARGPSGIRKEQQRLAYSEHRGIVFQIRGDWQPAKDKSGELIDDEEDADHYGVRFLKLPKEPLKVDGIFGQHTQAAVALFQHHQGLAVTGEVDNVTLDKLEPLVPTNPILAFIMTRIQSIFGEGNDYYPHLVKTCTSVLATLLILLAAAVVFQIARSLANSTHFLSRWLFTPESSPWFSALHQHRFFRRGAHFGPALFILFAGLLVFPSPGGYDDIFPYLDTFQDWNLMVSHLGLAYISLVVMLVGFAAANAVDSIANPDQETDNPIGSVIRASKRLIGLLGTLLIVASLAGKSPFLIVGGLGAFMAIFMLVFKDTLLGLVSSVQIIANKVVQIGDWISMPSYHADGEVQKISLSLIKVQNADKTISTIPTNAVLTDSFQNWSGVEKSGGRRIKRSILIDMRRIKVCTPEMIARFEEIELIQAYLDSKKTELEEYNRQHKVQASAVNSRRLTNIGTFRAYLDAFLIQHPGLSVDMTHLVRQLQPTSNGLPIEIYAFCNSTEWAKFEAIQADIFDHVLAILPEFELRAFQELTESDAETSRMSPRLGTQQAGLAEIESLVEAKNRELADKPRTKTEPRLQSLRKRIEELDLNDHFTVTGKGRLIILEHLQDR